jgi:tetratricopeptide (TPR) repeat protein
VHECRVPAAGEVQCFQHERGDVLFAAVLAGHQRDYTNGLDHARRALELLRRAGHRPGVAHALNAAGWFQIRLGEYGQGLTYCDEALRLHRAAGNRRAEAATLDSLAVAYHQLGDHGTANDYYERALTMFRELGHRLGEADTLTHLGDSHHVNNPAGHAPPGSRPCTSSPT